MRTQVPQGSWATTTIVFGSADAVVMRRSHNASRARILQPVQDLE
jgi:hypothetical protein